MNNNRHPNEWDHDSRIRRYTVLQKVLDDK
jgi:hypothetical protein